MMSFRRLVAGVVARSPNDEIEVQPAQDLQGSEVSRMRTITRIGFGALGAAMALACLLAAQTAQAQVPICLWPASVPAELRNSIATKVVITPSPGPDLCAEIASAEVKACSKAVQIAAACNDILNNTYATAYDANCSTLPDASAQQACSDSVQAELAALSTNVRDAASAGSQTCLDMQPTIYTLCVGAM